MSPILLHAVDSDARSELNSSRCRSTVTYIYVHLFVICLILRFKYLCILIFAVGLVVWFQFDIWISMSMQDAECCFASVMISPRHLPVHVRLTRMVPLFSTDTNDICQTLMFITTDTGTEADDLSYRCRWRTESPREMKSNRNVFLALLIKNRIIDYRGQTSNAFSCLYKRDTYMYLVCVLSSFHHFRVTSYHIDLDRFCTAALLVKGGKIRKAETSWWDLNNFIICDIIANCIAVW